MRRHTTNARSIRITDTDLPLMGKTGMSIVHNVISNQKPGAEVAPVKCVLRAGIDLALGSDGVCSSDSKRKFDMVVQCGPTGLRQSRGGSVRPMAKAEAMFATLDCRQTPGKLILRVAD